MIVRPFRMIFVALLLLLPGWSANAAESGFVLCAPDKKTVIVVEDGWKPKEWTDWGSHLVLQAFLKAITGRVVPIVTASELGSGSERAAYDSRLWLGRQPEVERAVGAELDKLDADGFLIRAEGADLYIAGRNWWGSIWAVYDLLETYAGCRWYGPLEPVPALDRNSVGLFDIVPRRETVGIPANLHRVQEPSYKSRSLPNTPCHSFRQRRRDRFHHNMGRIIDPARYGSQFPEIFPLVDGKRLTAPENALAKWHPVVANPKTLELTVRYIKDFFRDNPGENTISLGMNDGGNFPAEDEALAPPAITGKNQRLAWAWFDFYNKVALEVEKEYPDKRLGCLAYAVLSSLPEGSIKLHRNLVPYLTRDSAQLFDPAQQKEFADTVAKWSRMTSRMGIYEYLYGGGFLIPRIYNRFLIANIKNRYGAGVDGFYAEVYPNWGMDGPKYWLTAKMLWNNTQDPDALLEDYFTHLFGPAAGDMRAYFDFLEETWCTQTLVSPRSNYRWFKDPKQFEIFPPDKCEKALGFFERAEKAAVVSENGGTILRRIGFFKNTFALTCAMSARYHGVRRAEEIWREAKGRTDEDRLVAASKALESIYTGFNPREALNKVLELKSMPYLSTFARTVHRKEDYSSEVLDKALKSAVPVGIELAGAAQAGCEKAHPGVSELNLNRLAMDWVSQNAQRLGPSTVERLLNPILSTSVLGFPALDGSPRIDGVIEPDEPWGAPLNAIPFFSYGETEPATDKTHFYGGWRDDTLYLAFDFEQAPETVGAEVSEDELTGWRGTRMQKDDAVVIGFTNDTDNRCESVRVNANGAVGFNRAGDRWPGLLESAVKKTGHGWQVELAIARNGTMLQAKAEKKTFLSVVRYARAPLMTTSGTVVPGEKKFLVHLSSLTPMANSGTTVGTGNFPNFMTFKGGASLHFVEKTGH